MKNWFVRLVRVNRKSIYIVACGVTSLIGIPTARLVIENGWGQLLYIVAINLAVAVIVTAALYPIVSKLPKVPKRPRRKPATGKLSWFAHKRIREEQPDLIDSPVVFEIRLARQVLFVPFPVKTRSTQKQREPDTIKDTARTKKGRLKRTLREIAKRAGDNTITVPALRLLVSVLLLIGVSAVLQLPGLEMGVVEAGLIIACLIYCLVRCVSLYHRLARWYCYRVIAFRSRDTGEYTIPAQLVVINKPLLLPGGSVPAIPIAKIQAPWTSTAPKGESEEAKLSILAGLWKLSYILADIIGEEAELFEWMGPFEDAVHYNNELKKMIAESSNL